MKKPVTIARTYLPVSMEGDPLVLRHALREVAEQHGCDPDTIRNVRSKRYESVAVFMDDGEPLTVLTATAEADLRDG